MLSLQRRSTTPRETHPHARQPQRPVHLGQRRRRDGAQRLRLPPQLRTALPALVDPGSPAGSFAKEGGAGKVSTEYQVEAFPTFYVINPKGSITWRSGGEQPDALLGMELLKAAHA